VLVTIIGATSWGTTLANLISNNKIPTVLLTRTNSEKSMIEKNNSIPSLPDIKISQAIRISADASATLPESDVIILAVPSDRIQENLERIPSNLKENLIIVSGVKGLNSDSGDTMSSMIKKSIPIAKDRVVVISGPNLSREIAQNIPSSTIVACENLLLAKTVKTLLDNRNFGVYLSDDVTGVELGGALKNVIAITAGIVDGLEYGANSKSIIVNKGLHEILQLAIIFGGKSQTVFGLSGLGDLIATCFSTLSRNRYVGEQIGKGNQLYEITKKMKNVAEGINTTKAALVLAKQHKLKLPLIEGTGSILFNNSNPRELINLLLSSPTD
jgi:glycerol-3-phosphate dehydrogenase (NAD(P)+)